MESLLNLDNASYHSIQNILSSCLLSKSTENKTYGTIILSVVLRGCETWPLTLKEIYRLKESQNKLLMRVCGPKHLKY
jgi:hypothetical protein